MNDKQARHARAMADKMLTHLQRMTWEMEAVKNMEDRDVKSIPVENIEERFTGLEMTWRRMVSVNKDMLPELKAYWMLQ